MNTDSLKEQREEVEKKFNEIADRKKQDEEELLRLQGEYRSLSSLISQREKPKVSVKGEK